jgi:hypothetical protein
MISSVHNHRAPRHYALAATVLVVACLSVPLRTVFASPSIGEPAPAFSAVDSQGVVRSLGDFAGRTVVLEWTNRECPYIGKHYRTGN